MSEFGYDLLSLLLWRAWPIWFAAGVLSLFVVRFAALPNIFQSFGLGFVTFASSLLLYAVLGRPGFEDWRFTSRPDGLTENDQPPILLQTAVRLENDPKDSLAYAAAGDYFAASLDADDKAAVYADFSYREAERFGNLSADQYARWASVLVKTNLDFAEGYTDHLDRLIAAALKAEPDHAHAKFLATERLPRDEALPKLRDIADSVSADDPLAETIDDRILLALVGEPPSIAPSFDEIGSERVGEVMDDVTEFGDPPFVRMIRQLEAKVMTQDGKFLVPEGDAELDQLLAIDLARLGRAQLKLALYDKARFALLASSAILDAGDPLQFWIARDLWLAGAKKQSIEILQSFRTTLPEASPQWRAVGLNLERLTQNLGKNSF